MANLFGVTEQDLQRKIAPVASTYEFEVGTDISSADASGVIDLATERLLSVLPRHYRNALEHVEEVLTYSSAEGATSFSTSFSPVSNLKVYTDYPARRWDLRVADDLTDESYTADASGNITFDSALNEGTSVFVEYDHTGASGVSLLKDWATTLAAIEIERRYWFHRDESGGERFDSWKTDYDNWVVDLRRGRTGINELDKLELLDGSSRGNDVNESFYSPMLRM